MIKALTFKIEIEGLETKIWRKIEITDRRTVADLAYTILATFDSLAYHLYEIKYKEKIFDCWICIEENHREEELTNATITKLKDIGLIENDTMIMEYDTGSTTTFKITYLGSREFEKNNGMHYPYVIDGAGHGMLDDICDFELKEIVEDIDKKGYSKHYFTPGYCRNKTYEYKDFNIAKNIIHIRRYFPIIKNGYEEEYD